MNKYFLSAVAALALLAAPIQARADAILTLTPVVGNTVGPQSSSNPCIIAGTNCGNPSTFGYNNYTPNNDSSYDRYSTSQGGSNGTMSQRASKEHRTMRWRWLSQRAE